MSETINIGYVHTLIEAGGPCTPDCPHPAHLTCHCGKAVVIHVFFHGQPAYTRGLCRHCDEVRCDAFPGECR